ncbi:dihydrofolate reductase [Clostridium tyrobutyricum]|jgi:dihydrofolate reductase|uniref:Dihydrofolate reductase n=1 Tax=Clostridium tyrobutyricum DIVETGP TaxID=1408889 RepID=W6N6C8_CLOTY|nr:dihydrofolate reductase [Clostridium tyrobutyricum]AND84939.1 dihydrofolate reductase [Clostridium tyrobutyricum]ANP69508.1 diacylglycerol kinase [Clostridium tyrobutyricum]MBR9649160.1 dihydrofolate reductase [Clostridium tyrobutyricum]MBV4414770.1 dihydrofolate reductase [Clostridium tyrobutyricum]MBV4423740.1 dihydrofolate reductase [Clostridium tyrobutyricum]
MLSIIAILNQNNLIGRDNKLIWHISRDLKRFKYLTSDKTVIMGRKTFESLPGILPDRDHIIITRNKNYAVSDKKVTVIHDITSILKYMYCKKEAFVIGGGEIYKQLLPYCNKLYLTEVISDETGDTYFPKFNRCDYHIVEYDKYFEQNIEYNFITLEKIDYNYMALFNH